MTIVEASPIFYRYVELTLCAIRTPKKRKFKHLQIGMRSGQGYFLIFGYSFLDDALGIKGNEGSSGIAHGLGWVWFDVSFVDGKYSEMSTRLQAVGLGSSSR